MTMMVDREISRMSLEEAVWIAALMSAMMMESCGADLAGGGGVLVVLVVVAVPRWAVGSLD